MKRDWELWFAYMEGVDRGSDEVIDVRIPVHELPILQEAADVTRVRIDEFLELAVWERITELAEE